MDFPPGPSDGSSDNDRVIETDKEELCRVLDSFPLSQAELERMLAIKDRLTAADCSFSSVMSNLDAASSFVESCVLPEQFLGKFFRTAVSTVFVIGSPLDQMEKWTYLEATMTCLGRRGSRCVNDLMFSYCGSNDGSDDVRTEKVLNLVYRIVLASHFLRVGLPDTEVAMKTPSAWVSSLSTEYVSRRRFLEWISHFMPFMYTAASTMFHCIFISPHHSNFQPEAFSLPKLDAETLFWTNPWEAIPVSLACQVSVTRTLHPCYLFAWFQN